MQIEPKPTDAELWEAIKLDKKEAFDMLFERYWHTMYTSAYNHLRDTASSADVVNDVFINIWNKRGVLEIGSLKNYLISATRYHVYRALKERRKSIVMYVDHYGDTAKLNGTNLGEESLANSDMGNSLHHLLMELPKRCREIFILSRMQHFSNDEIATKLGISKRTIENQITHALKYLRMHQDKYL